MNIKRYTVVASSDARTGMCLHDDVLDRAGNLLLPKGTALTASLIAALVRHGIATLHIVDDSVTEVQLAAARAEVKGRLAHLSRHWKPGTAGTHLLRLVEDYRTERLT